MLSIHRFPIQLYNQVYVTHLAPVTTPPLGTVKHSLNPQPPGRMQSPHTLLCLYTHPPSCRFPDLASSSKATFPMKLSTTSPRNETAHFLIPLGTSYIFLPLFKISQIVFQLSVHVAFSCISVSTLRRQWQFYVVMHRAFVLLVAESPMK